MRSRSVIQRSTISDTEVQLNVNSKVSLPVAKRRHPFQWLAVAVILLLFSMLVHTIMTNPAFQWSVVGQYVFSQTILYGLLRTLALTAIAMFIGIVLGLILAVMRLSSLRLLRVSSTVYITAFRGTPVLVQLIFWFNLAVLFPTVALGIPYGAHLVNFNSNNLVTPWTAAILGLGLNEAAYMSEILRAGILSVHRGQIEAAESLGMTKGQVLRKVVLPQAMRIVIPPTGNETISMLKTTAIVSVIALSDLLYAAESIYTRTYQIVPLLIVASLWYCVATVLLSLVQQRIERHYLQGVSPQNSKAQKRTLNRLLLGGGSMERLTSSDE